MPIPAHLRTQAVPATIEAANTLAPVLRRHPRAAKALSVILAAHSAHKALTVLRERLTPPAQEEETWTVTVKADDSLYEHALALLADQTTVDWQHVEAEWAWKIERDDDGDVQETPEVSARPAQDLSRSFRLDGHTVSGYVQTFTARRASGPGHETTAAYSVPVRTPEVTFTASSSEGQRAVLAELRRRAVASSSKRRERRAKFFRSSGGWGGGWDRGSDLPVRPVESVAVTDGQVQRIVDDIVRFRELESEYVRRGVPFHRGYLLYGPPGTGKTSAVKAIAHATGSDLYMVSLSRLDDSTLTSLVASVSRSRHGAILVLEDIDSFGAALQREDDDEGDETGRNAGISTTGLLNALDGIETPHGLVTIMTTNHPERLDKALVRPGRVDLQVEFGYPDDATVERHFAYFFGRQPSVPLYADGRSGADLNEVFVAHMTDPEGAERILSTRRTHAA